MVYCIVSSQRKQNANKKLNQKSTTSGKPPVRVNPTFMKCKVEITKGTSVRGVVWVTLTVY